MVLQSTPFSQARGGSPAGAGSPVLRTYALRSISKQHASSGSFRRWFAMWIRIMTAALAIVAGQSALAPVESWERLKLIPPHVRLVRMADGKEVRYLIRAWKPDGLTLARGKQANEIARVDVERVSTTVSGSRARGTGWAALIGAGVGGVLYIGLCSAGARIGFCCAEQSRAWQFRIPFIGVYSPGPTRLTRR
jgi:hypothetical protein